MAWAVPQIDTLPTKCVMDTEVQKMNDKDPEMLTPYPSGLRWSIREYLGCGLK